MVGDSEKPMPSPRKASGSLQRVWQGFLAPLRDPDAWVWIGLILGFWFTIAMAWAYLHRCVPDPNTFCP